jgi:ribose 1,5-bisphosphokinase
VSGAVSGRLVLVVGPSGAGKDSVIRAARAHLGGDPRFVFPRRVVTRPSSEEEDNVEFDTAGFERMAASGEFLVAWSAHGLHYGIPSTILSDVELGRCVICNVSRTVVGELRIRLGARVRVVEITAAPDILAARLAARSRPSDGDVSQRLERSASLPASMTADMQIRNEQGLEEACASFVAFLQRS